MATPWWKKLFSHYSKSAKIVQVCIRYRGEEMISATNICPLCSSTNRILVKTYKEPPKGEPLYGFAHYHRDLWHCQDCGHYTNDHPGMDLSRLYQGAYGTTNYSTARFDKIMALPASQSDNQGRANYIDRKARDVHVPAITLLDIGSGMAVFPAAMRARGWEVSALDPDPANNKLAREQAMVIAIQANFMNYESDLRYGLVTLNKVLEHVTDPAAMLRRAARFVMPGGLLYIELPDGEIAMQKNGPESEEFFIEHLHVFSMQSMRHLIQQVGLKILAEERLLEPSSKYTLRAVLTL
jgi:SAM-dependent methyltransferase